MKSAVIVAGGSSTRFEQNKLFAPLFDKTLIQVTVDAFCEVADEIVLVVNAKDMMQMTLLFANSKIKLTVGGDTRTQSVLNGLKAISDKSTLVAIHDGARPYVSKQLVQTCFDTAQQHGSAIPVLKAVDTIYIKQDENAKFVDRNNVCQVQTPQTFDTARIKQAYANIDTSKSYTDDSQVYLDHFGSLHFVEGEKTNIKITYPSDLFSQSIGNGFDVHPLVENRKLILCGVEIPYHLGLDGHSDADVAVHAIMDAVLSSIGERDIGVHFPDNDDSYKGISSILLLQKVAQLVKNKNAKLQSISCVIMAQAPKLAPYIPQMARNVATVLNLPTNRVNISATTTEKLGIIGEGKGIAAQAVCLTLG